MTEFAKNLPMRGNVTSGMDQISDMPRCRVVQTGAQSYAAGVITAIIWDSPNFTSAYGGWDTDGFYNDVASRTRLTVRTSGVYDVKAKLAFAGSAAGANRLAWVQKNGVTTIRYGFCGITVVAAIASLSSCNVATTMDLFAGDYVELMGYQDSGVPLSTTQDNNPCAELMLTLLSTK